MGNPISYVKDSATPSWYPMHPSEDINWPVVIDRCSKWLRLWPKCLPNHTSLPTLPYISHVSSSFALTIILSHPSTGQYLSPISHRIAEDGGQLGQWLSVSYGRAGNILIRVYGRVCCPCRTANYMLSESSFGTRNTFQKGRSETHFRAINSV